LHSDRLSTKKVAKKRVLNSDIRIKYLDKELKIEIKNQDNGCKNSLLFSVKKTTFATKL